MRPLDKCHDTWLTTHMNTKTATGTVHHLTVGRTYKQYGTTCVNREDSVIGRADCGAQTSSAATHTSEAVTCLKCVAKGA